MRPGTRPRRPENSVRPSNPFWQILKPEAVYFTDNNGQRTAFIFLDMQDASQIPAIAEPWLLAFNASIEIHPVMVPDDLARAGGAIALAVKKYA